jgi:hypothetical protein
MKTDDVGNSVIAWLDWDTSLFPPTPVLILEHDGFVKKFPLSEKCTLNLNINPTRKFCIGYFDEFDKNYLCRSGNIVQRGLQCPECLNKDIYWKCAMCKGVYCLNPKANDFCSQNSHTVYLAAYSPELLKVGVSWSPRFQKRIAEQGANVAVKIAECKSGFDARKLEREINKQLKIPDRIPLKGKQSSLHYNYYLSDMTDLLFTMREKTIIEFKGSNFDNSFLKHEPVYDLYTPYQKLLNEQNDNTFVILDNKKNPPKTLRGEFLDQKGFYSIIKVTADTLYPTIVAIPLKDYFGYKIINGSILCED